MKLWLFPSYKPEAPSSQMRVYKIAPLLKIPTTIIPYNLSIEEKLNILKSAKKQDYILIQKWRNEFNQAKYIQDFPGTKIFDMDDICEDQNVIDLATACDVLFMANHFLFDWAKKFNKPTYIIPTGIDMPGNLTPYNHASRQNIIIAKYGVDKYIPMIARIPGWKDLFNRYNIALRILGTTKESSKNDAQQSIGHYCKTYNLVSFSSFWKTYGKIISTAVCGIMPLSKSAQGKSAFSVLTMMSAGVPVIASPYGECDYIIQNEINGFLAHDIDDWYTACDKLLSQPKLREKMSVEAIKTIVQNYTIEKIAGMINKII